MSSRYERTIQFFDVDITGRTQARDVDEKHKRFSSPRSLDQLMKEIDVVRELNMARKKAGKKSKYQFALEDLAEKPDCWVLLVNLVDSNAANLVTNKIDGSEADRQTIEFNDDQGLESSAHIVIFKKPNQLKKHLVLFEKSSSVPFQKASSFLNHLARVAARHHKAQYELAHPSGDPSKKINAYCRLELFAHPSDEFKDELGSGKLKEIRLTSDTVMLKGYDSAAQPELVGTEVKVNVSKAAVVFSGGNLKHLGKALKHAKDLDVPYVRVAFEDKTGTAHTAILSADTGTLQNKDRYVKKRKINKFRLPLSTAVPVINEEIAAQMIELQHD